MTHMNYITYMTYMTSVINMTYMTYVTYETCINYNYISCVGYKNTDFIKSYYEKLIL